MVDLPVSIDGSMPTHRAAIFAINFYLQGYLLFNKLAYNLFYSPLYVRRIEPSSISGNTLFVLLPAKHGYYYTVYYDYKVSITRGQYPRILEQSGRVVHPPNSKLFANLNATTARIVYGI